MFTPSNVPLATFLRFYPVFFQQVLGPVLPFIFKHSWPLANQLINGGGLSWKQYSYWLSSPPPHHVTTALVPWFTTLFSHFLPNAQLFSSSLKSENCETLNYWFWSPLCLFMFLLLWEVSERLTIILISPSLLSPSFKKREWNKLFLFYSSKMFPGSEVLIQP